MAFYHCTDSYKYSEIKCQYMFKKYFQMSTNQIQESDIPSIVGPMSNEPGNVFMDPSAQGAHPMNQMTSGGPGSNPMTILNPSSTNHQNHHNHHGSVRDQIVVGSSGGSATQIHTIRSSQSNSGM